jgi:alkaline phosphatase D
VKAGKPWQILGNQVVMARVAGPDLERAMGAEAVAALIGGLPAQYRTGMTAAAKSYRAGVPFNLDAWDGYPPARERLYATFRAARTRPLVLSGDSHAFWANDLYDDAGRLVAAEFGTTRSPARPTETCCPRPISARSWPTPIARSPSATRTARGSSC